MDDSTDHRLDIVSLPDGSIRDARSEAERPGTGKRPWIGVSFECCGIYARVYRRPEADRYEGHCPRCGRALRVQVSPEGVNARILRARPV